MSDAQVRALLRGYEASREPGLLDQAVRVALRSGLPLPVDHLERALRPSRSFESRFKFKVWALVPGAGFEGYRNNREAQSTRRLPSFSWLTAVALGDTPGAVEIPEHAMFWVEPVGSLGKRLEKILEVVSDQDADGVSLDGSKVTDSMLEPLADCDSLRYLSLQGCHNVTSEGLRWLPESMRALALGQCNRVSDAGLGALARLPVLTWLDVSGSTYTGDCLPALAQLPLLTRVNIRGFKSCGTRHVPALVAAPNLRRLTSGGNATLGSLASLKDLSSLTHLDFMGMRLSDVGLKYVAKIKTLRHLNLTPDYTCRRVSPSGLASMAKKLPDLQSLDLRPGWWGFEPRVWGWNAGDVKKLRSALPERVELRV